MPGHGTTNATTSNTSIGSMTAQSRTELITGAAVDKAPVQHTVKTAMTPLQDVPAEKQHKRHTDFGKPSIPDVLEYVFESVRFLSTYTVFT